MNRDPSAIRTEDLLENLDWLRRLARSLVLDASRADDLVQDAMLAALQFPPEKPGVLRSWLRTVTRNLAFREHRTGIRRSRRELEAALQRERPENESVEQIVERAELQGQLVEAVLELQEPYRSTVVLRYFEGLSSNEVAARLRVEPGAVRVRLSRAHNQLRTRLLDRHGGDRSACCVALVCLARPSAGSSGAATGASGSLASLITQQPLMLAAIAAILILGAFIGLQLPNERLPERGDELAGSRSLAETGVTDSSIARAVRDGTDAATSERPLATASDGPAVGGTVIDMETLEPLAGVRVRRRSARSESFAETDQNGRFRFADVDGGGTVEILDDVYLPAGKPALFDTTRPASLIGVELMAALGAIVRGRVVDSDSGRSISGIIVRVFDVDRAEVIRLSAPTDADGRFEIAGLGAGRMQVSPAETEFYREVSPYKRVRIQSRPGAVFEEIELVLARSIPVTGRVIGDGKDVAGAQVRCWHQWHKCVTAVADQHGRFSVQVPRPPKWSSTVYVSARTEDMASRLVGPLRRTDPSLSDLELELLPLGSLSGVFRVDEGETPPGIPVKAWPVKAFNVRVLETETVEGGGFTFGPVAAGTYRIGSREVTVAPGQPVTGIEIRGLRGPSFEISGRVTNLDGVALRDVSVLLSYFDKALLSTTTGEDGVYRLEGVPTGAYEAYRVSVSAEGYVDQLRKDVRAGSADVDFVLVEQSSVSGVVISADTGLPVRNFAVSTLVGEPTPLEVAELSWMREISDPEGRFEIDQVSGPSSTLVVRARGHVPSMRLIENLIPGETREGILATLEPFRGVRGIVLNSVGAPVPDALIFDGAIPPAGLQEEYFVTRTDPSGRFELDALLSPRGSLFAVRPDHAAGRLDYDGVRVSGQEVTIVIREWATITGVVRRGEDPVPNARVDVLRNDLFELSVATDAKGRYLVRVRAGSLKLVANLPAADSIRKWESRIIRPVVVEEGRTHSLDFSLVPKAAIVEGSISLAGRSPHQCQMHIVPDQSDLDILPVAVDSGGRFRFEAPVGRLSLMVKAEFEGGRTFTRTVSVETRAGQRTPVVFDSFRGERLRVRVSGLKAGEEATLYLLTGKSPVENVTRQGLREHVSRYAGRETTVGGSATFDGVAPGIYNILCGAGPSDKLNRLSLLPELRISNHLVDVPDAARHDVKIRSSAR